MKCLSLFALTFVLAATCVVLAQGSQQSAPKPAALKTAWGDQGDGTFVNPILPSDYSDIDAIRVQRDYYAISSTFQFSPGVIILHSKDLVNWQIAGHAVDDLTRIAPQMNWDAMDRYGRGIWAGAIRYHNGKFHIYFGTPDEGFFVTAATDAAGPWEPLQPFWKVKGWDDCCPFWDDDGQGYFVASNFSDGYKIHLFKMTADGKSLAPGYDKVLYQSRGSEANKLYKINGVYCHLFSEVHSEGRVVMMRRAKSLDGPWESRQLIHVAKGIDKEPNQGGIVDTPSGEWWFVTHQGTGDWEGRAMSLLPVTWNEGWPILGKPGSDGVGSMVWSATKPALAAKGEQAPAIPVSIPQTDDAFDGPALGPQWEWNYQPRNDKWSLTERPGFLRLHAFKPLKAGDLLKAGNTLTQRTFRTEANTATAKLDISNMADGQEAGLCHFGKSWATLGISQTNGTRTLVFSDNGKVTSGPALSAATLWLRTTWDFDGVSHFSFSTDGQSFTPFGPPFKLAWGYYRGDRLGLYSFNNTKDAGFLDVDSFTCEVRQLKK